MEILRVENLTKVYGKGENEVRALDGVSFSVEKGAFVAVIGPSGSGKSTLLHILGGVDRPTGGKVFMDGKDVYAQNEEQLAIFRRRQVGLIYQFYNLIPVLNVTENITLPVLMDGQKVNQNRLAELFEAIKKPGQNFAGACFTSGSAGTMSAGDLLKERYPHLKLAVGEALQCPTILNNGFGGHRIEGIGDKHIPWIHNVKNTDMAIAIDDEDSQRLLRLFNTAEGKAYMKNELGMSDEQVEKMSWLGISGIANVLCCIKMAKYYELTENDVVGTVLTDSAVMYQSRIEELNEMHGAYNAHEAAMDHALHMLGLKTDNMMEMGYAERKRVHNLKYYTWVEQQGMTVEDLNAQWYDTKGTWDAVHAQAKDLDELINEFNEATGLLKDL